MMILVTGSGGQLGKEISLLLKRNDINFFAYDRNQLDITNIETLERVFEKNKPKIVYHCAAYTAVDAAEDEGAEQNKLVNVLGTEIIAKMCQKYNSTLVFISTDYVFDGKERDNGYLETDITNPINAYGRAKQEAEQIVQQYCSKFYIIRTSWVFGQYGKNFVYTMMTLAEKNDKLTVVNDQIGRPTWTKSLAEFMIFLTKEHASYGIYHFANEGTCTWYEFAKEILKNQPVKIEPVTSDVFKQKAVRPTYSVLSLEKTNATGFQNISWQEALEKFKEEI
ncbi:dTDP-4-dehydrorhamnose reductase [Vagococcus lutrae]|uniref:dTDP-4-dehydrorhamnose reductase n=1 Tax=Vagococcus lutrae TaxID=81947 RepID=UPI0028925129|nr:dTDP-4-dehydrorhamnose reductase [Vagococcus lutrae]MDT2811535.1 dTDP-4-dehydrorhamnose reductase [Vagococcus lutrae]